jgi:hypothetical protein
MSAAMMESRSREGRCGGERSGCDEERKKLEGEVVVVTESFGGSLC